MGGIICNSQAPSRGESKLTQLVLWLTRPSITEPRVIRGYKFFFLNYVLPPTVVKFLEYVSIFLVIWRQKIFSGRKSLIYKFHLYSLLANNTWPASLGL